MPTIRTILPQKKEEEKKLLRVAAYCRVSSDSDDQMVRKLCEITISSDPTGKQSPCR